MKSNLFKNIGALVIVSGFIFMAFGSGESNKNDSTNSTNSDSYDSYSGFGSSTSYVTKTCSWCGTTFTGNHYTHFGNISACEKVGDDKPSMGKYCSLRCCSEARNSRR